MNHSKCPGYNVLTPSHVSDITLLALVKQEIPNVTTVVFSNGEVVPVDINPDMNLGDIVEQLSQVPPGPVFYLLL
ncbi:hypothetical protein CEXT_84171 [Caerostris extrusa]|uniref:RNA-binding protein RO60 vWA domain-containing protein n=1 Tax=Caerostris extrusa TaxID=172846 RepID=A0AAV4NJT3_CAEEX|nr:hypothetical protein CEXT_84171 [Caerostris extrusa]